MHENRGQRVRRLALAAVAALLLVGTAGCGGGSIGTSSDGGSDLRGRTTQAAGTESGGDLVDGSKGAGAKLPDPCDLVPIAKASEILGGESAKPDATISEGGPTTKSCSWQTQAGIDNPKLDGAGHVLVLQVVSPPGTMSVDEFWKASKSASDPDAGIDGCDQSFWLGGMLSALKHGVYLTGTAGLADDSAGAKESVTELVSTACGSLS